jgi:hypothetical protein
MKNLIILRSAPAAKSITDHWRQPLQPLFAHTLIRYNKA